MTIPEHEDVYEIIRRAEARAEQEWALQHAPDTVDDKLPESGVLIQVLLRRGHLIETGGDATLVAYPNYMRVRTTYEGYEMVVGNP